MMAPRVEMMAVSTIFVGDRHRQITPAAVDALARSIKDNGLQQPITVRLVQNVVINGEEWDNAAYLVAGAHRLAACQQLGWHEIPCIEVAADDVKAEMLEIAENLHRCDLSKEERDRQIRRYAELLEVKDRQPRQDVAPVLADGRRKGPQHEKGTAAKVAEETGLSVRTVQRVLAPPKPVPPAREPHNDYEAVQKQVDSLMRAWNAAGPEAREQFLERVDRPVFDRTAAA